MESSVANTSSNDDIYWEELCGRDNQAWAFWSHNRTIDTPNPDFTLCFQYSILLWVPCAFLFSCTPFYLTWLFRRDSQRMQCLGKLNIFKMCLTVILIALMTVDLVHSFSQTKMVLNIYPVVVITSLLIALLLIRLEYKKAIHTSSILFTFWFLLTISSFFLFRSKILYDVNQDPIRDTIQEGTFLTFFPILVVQFVAHFFADTAVFQQRRSYNDERAPLLPNRYSNNINDTTNSNNTFDVHQQTMLDNPPCPQITSSFLSRITFYWIFGLIIKGYRRALTNKDLWMLRPADSCAYIMPTVEEKWEKVKSDFENKHTNRTSLPTSHESKKSRASLLKALTKAFGSTYAMAGLFKLIFDAINFLQPQILNALITFIGKDDLYDWHGYCLSAALFLVAMTRTLLNQQYWNLCAVTGMRMRTAIIGLVYRKSLRLSGNARKDVTVGEVVNLMSVDSQKLQDSTMQLHALWTAPITIIVAVYFIWQQLGPAALAGVAAMLLLLPINASVVNKARIYQLEQMKLKDNRIKLMNEILSGIKVLKLYAWENSFQDQVENIRHQEVQLLLKSATLSAFSFISFTVAPCLVALSTFATYVLEDSKNILDPQKAFVSLSLFNIMQFPLAMLPNAINTAVQCLVSVDRINKFLLEEELAEDAVVKNNFADYPIEIENGTFCWGKNELPVLKSINLKVRQGSLVAVVGTVGSGKTSFVSAILGETERRSGRVTVKGSIAYVPQQAWCQNATLRNNIVFGKAFNKDLYKRTIEACALEPDLKILPGGDETEIGEKGINMSGGQKQRIALARAVYQDSDVYILDDPLSAVDSHVGKHIFDKVISKQGVLRGKTRILVTHGIHFLPRVDHIVVLKDGHVSESGTFNELVEHHGAFADFLLTYLEKQAEEEDEEDVDEETAEIRKSIQRQMSLVTGFDKGSIDSDSSLQPSVPQRKTSAVHLQNRRRSSAVDLDELKAKVEAVEKNKLIKEEVTETGSVKLDVYLSYIRALSKTMIYGTMVFYIGNIGVAVGTNIWLSIWSQDSVNYGPTTANETQAAPPLSLRLGVYGAFGAALTIVSLFFSLGIAIGTYRASKNMHAVMISNLMRAPMSFFDTTPIGRIVNRFAKDIDTIDLSIPFTLRIWLMTFSNVLSTLIVISISTPVFLVVLLPLGILYYLIQRFYVQTSRQLKRIDSVKRSPIYSHFQESIIGAPSIRAYTKQDEFIEHSDKLVDENQMAWYPATISNRWLSVNLEILGNLIILFAGVFAVLSRSSTNAGFAGLSISYSLQITAILNALVQSTCDLENYLVAVERVKEYSEIESEADWITFNRPPSDWPTQGKVQFTNYGVRYREGLDLVIKDINVDIAPGEKIGIVGRTGAGKSSLTLALFRLLEPATGQIKIDGLDVTQLGLHDLRKGLTIIPQDPVLFSGSLRLNLDPFEEHNDSDVWKSLEQAHLRDFVSTQSDGLHFKCVEGGENLSVGQRQLVCLARALLRKTKILILDEATAAVDLETDELIQSTIRREFRNSTVLTIAHRLNTIMDYDRIMVLDKGELREFDSPKMLLLDDKTIFSSMARDAGLV